MEPAIAELDFAEPATDVAVFELPEVVEEESIALLDSASVFTDLTADQTLGLTSEPNTEFVSSPVALQGFGQSVPEPSTTLLMISAITALLAFAGRRRNR